MKSARVYFPQLDGLRAVAVLIVVIGHELLTTRWHELASVGVLLFFVLSGFLITTLLCVEERDTGAISLRGFYLRRALRILPASYFLLAVTAVLVAAGWVTDVKWSNIAAAILYVRNLFGTGATLTHLWSLSLEEQFYLVWPLLFVAIPPRARLRSALGIIAVCVAWRTTAMSLHLYDRQPGTYYIRTDFRFDSILAGCALALATKDRPGAVRYAARFALPLPILAALVASCLDTDARFAPYVLTVQTLLATALLAHLVTVEGDGFGRLLSTAPLRWVGRLSYSWYLWQQIFLVTREPSWGPLRRFPVDVIASIAAALVSFYVVERPFLRWKSRLPREIAGAVSGRALERAAG
jgi:peptidoglycan/LPS O-acetylase OafA/YrhL